jgi:hypothetical protein
MEDRPHRLKSQESRIPTFRTVEEEAEFWDTHDSADFEDELEEVTDLLFFAVQSKDELVLRITGDDLAALVERAREVDTTPARLAYDWIQEWLGAASPASSHNAR